MSSGAHEAVGDGTGIVVDGVTKRFGSVVALNAIELVVPPGELVVILGENGAGKSSLLRVLGTTVLPDSGMATIAGYDIVREAAQCRRATGVVFGDERSWYWRLTGRANLEFFAALYHLDRRSARIRTRQLLSLVGLESVADRRFDGFSSGMRARLSIARALLIDPTVMLLDEPSGTLDPLAAADLRRFVTGLVRDHDKAVLWVTHDLAEAIEIADRVAIMASGSISTADAPRSTSELAELLAAAAPQCGNTHRNGIGRT